MTRAAIFDAIKNARNGVDWKTAEIFDTDAFLDKLGVPRDGVAGAVPSNGKVSIRALGEIVSHEAIIQESYKDSKAVWTWSAGITSASGHDVDRYKDNPQPIRKCLEIYYWLLTTKYLPDVLSAFHGRALSEAQLAAALSFHWNTGAIKVADWVESWLAGKPTQARSEFMNYRKPPEIIERREKERDLFFDGEWSGDGKVTLYQVRKPSYTPNWGSAKRIDITADLAAISGGQA